MSKKFASVLLAASALIATSVNADEVVVTT